MVVNTAYCKFQVEYTYGCTGCDEPTRIGIKSYNISVYGSLYLHSVLYCTGLSDYLSCQEQPYEVLIPSVFDICNISLYSRRAEDGDPIQVILITLPKIFVGGLRSLELLTLSNTSPGGVEMVTNTLSHPKFFESAFYSGLVTGLIPILVRMIIALKALDLTRSVMLCRKRSSPINNYSSVDQSV